MFKWVKKLINTKEKPPMATTASVTAPKAKTEASAPKAKKSPSKKTNAHTKASLEKLTKVAIDELAKSDFGTDLDRRKTKDAMIKDFLAVQKSKK